MDRLVTTAIKRAGILLVAAVAGCGGSLPGKGGSDASGGAGGSPAACCPGGGQIAATVVHGRGFTAYEGRAVTAVFLDGTHVAATQATSVSGGAFDLQFPADGACADGGSVSGAGALYIDADGDGVCNPATDYLYVWPAFGTAGTCGTIDLSPQSINCGGGTDNPYFMLYEAAQAVCPATGECLTCPRSSPDAGTTSTCLV